MTKTGEKRQTRQRTWVVRFVALPVAFSLLPSALAETTEPIREVWRRPSPGAQCLAISPDGTRSTIVTWAGEVRCLIAGRLSWQRTVPGATTVVMGSGGRAMVYTPLDFFRRDLLVLDPAGQVSDRFTAGGPITTAAWSLDGRTIAVGNAVGAVELYRPGFATPPLTLVLPGYCQQLAFDVHGGLVVSTRAPATLSVFTREGRLRWRVQPPAGSEFRMGAAPRVVGSAAEGAMTVVAVVPTGARDLTRGDGGHRVAGVADAPAAFTSAPVAGADAAWSAPDWDQILLIAFADTGRPLWRQTLAGRGPSLSATATNGNTVVAYERADRRGMVVRFDRVLECFGRDGTRRWHSGGMVYNPLLIAASPNGETVLSLCSGNRFSLLNGQGRTLWSYTVGVPIRMARASADGSAVAVTTIDGVLSLLKVTSSSLSIASPAAAGGRVKRE